VSVLMDVALSAALEIHAAVLGKAHSGYSLQNRL